MTIVKLTKHKISSAPAYLLQSYATETLAFYRLDP